MCDVFSYGMVLYEIFDHKIPFADIPGDAVAGAAVLQGKHLPIQSNLPSYLRPLLKACWKKDPNQRPQFEAIVLAIQTQSLSLSLSLPLSFSLSLCVCVSLSLYSPMG